MFSISFNWVCIAVQRKQKGRDIGWLKTMLSSGTLSDKMASMILLIQVRELERGKRCE